MKPENPIQLNLNYIVKKPSFIISATLEGIYVCVVADKDNMIECKNYLLSLALVVVRESAHHIIIDLKSFLTCKSKDIISISGDLMIMREIHDANINDNKYTLSYENSEFNVGWKGGNTYYNEVISKNSIAAFLKLELNFIADALTWGEIARSVYAPTSIGSAKISFDGFVEINTNFPQLIETSGISSLFRISEYKYGCPISSIDEFPSKSISMEDQNIEEVLSSNINNSSSESILNKLRLAKFIAYDKEEESSKYSFLNFLLSNINPQSAVIVTNTYNYVGWRLFQSATKNKLLVLNYEKNSNDFINIETDLVIFDIEIADYYNFSNLKHFDSIFNIYKVLMVKFNNLSTEQKMNLFNSVKPSEFKSADSIFNRYPKNSYIAAANHMNSYIVSNINYPPSEIEINVKLSKIDVTHREYLDNLINCEKTELAKISLSGGYEKSLGGKISNIIESLAREDLPKEQNILILSNYISVINSVKIIIGKDKMNVILSTYEQYDGNLQNIGKIYLIDLPLVVNKKSKKIIRFNMIDVFFIDHKLEKELISDFFNNI